VTPTACYAKEDAPVQAKVTVVCRFLFKERISVKFLSGTCVAVCALLLVRSS
jgi:hypothetical protein